MPLVIALLALGGTGAAVYFATRKPDGPPMMLPGQTWQLFGFVDQKKPWPLSGTLNTIKDGVEKQILDAIAAMGFLIVDGNWSVDAPFIVDGVTYPTFLVGVQPNKPVPVIKTPATYPIVSDWSTYFVITAAAQAPANIPAPIGTIGNAFS